MSAMCRYLVGVLVPDRVGLLRDVTGVVAELGGNIVGIRQTLVDGFFNLVLTSDHPSEVSADALRGQLASRLEPGAAIVIQRDVCQPQPPLPGGTRYIVVTRGPDRPGTIHAISAFFCEWGVNIEDWQVASEGGDVLYTALVMLPDRVVFRDLQAAFRTRMGARGLAATICHENIFRATTEVGPIKGLLHDGSGCA